MPRGEPQPSASQALSAAALEVSAQRFERAYSPIVLAGFVRVFEALLVATIGLVLYFGYVRSGSSAAAYYFVSIAGISLLSMLAFQAADIYQVQAFRGHEKQYMRLAAAWSVVFLIAISVSYFDKAGDEFSRVWLGSFYVIGLVTLIGFRRALFLLVRRWTPKAGSIVAPSWSAQATAASLSAHWPRNAIPTSVSSACSTTAATSAAPRPATAFPSSARSTGLSNRPPRPRRPRHILAADFGGRPILQMLKKLWVLPYDIRLAAHSNKLQFRPRSYSYIGSVPVLDIFDKPIADWDVVMKWLFNRHRLDRTDLRCAHAPDCARDQTRQQGADPVQAAGATAPTMN